MSVFKVDEPITVCAQRIYALTLPQKEQMTA
jgi:hypothetical protein